MNILKASLKMDVKNVRLQIGTKQVNECMDMTILDEWQDQIEEDISRMDRVIHAGEEGENTVTARFLQCVLSQQITNRLQYLHSIYQPMISYLKDQHPDEYSKLLN